MLWATRRRAPLTLAAATRLAVPSVRIRAFSRSARSRSAPSSEERSSGRLVSWWRTISGREARTTRPSASRSKASTSTGVAPSARSGPVRDSVRVVPVTSCPARTRSFTSCWPMRPDAPARKMRAISGYLPGAMEARIVEFAEVLRQNGVRVATSELLDATRAATLVDIADREAFRSVLRTTMVKRSADRAPFDRAFDVFFSGAVSLLEGVEQSILDELAATGALEGDERTMTLATLNRLLGEMSPLTEAALRGDRARLAQLFRGATLQLDFSRLQSPLQAGFYARRLLAGAGGDGLRSNLGAIEAELRRRGISPEGFEWVSRRLSDLFRGLEADARREVERQARARLRGTSGALAERSFASLSRTELTQVQHAVRRLAERLKTRLVRRERSRRKGTLNVRRTLRRNMSWGGMPMVPVFRARRPQRPEVVVLCDVSESVRNVSRLMLLFNHTLQ